MVKVPNPPSVWILLIPILVIGVSSLLLPLLIWKRHPPPDEHAWRGIFYWNPADRALIVPKRFGIGYTLNFANPWSWVVLSGILAGIVLSVLFTGLSVRNVQR
jgi:uncharacterized membrane protein